MNRRRFLKTCGGTVAASTALAGCTSSSGSNGSQGNSGGSGGSGGGSQSQKSKKYIYTQSGIGIEGEPEFYMNDNPFMGPEMRETAVNITDHVLSYVQIDFAYYDRQNYQIGTAMDNTNNLGPGARWRFSAVSFEEFDPYNVWEYTMSISAW